MRTIMPPVSRTAPPAARLARKVRSSVVYCNEKYACNSDRAKASFTCEQCRTDQCVECERHLHELSRFAFHDRRRIKSVSADQLCDAPGSVGCQSQNLADLVCQDCNWRRYCFDCDMKVHRGRPLSTHRRMSVESTTVASPLLQDQGSVETSTFSSIDNADVTLATEHDNSLFLSFPGAQLDEMTAEAQSVVQVTPSDVTSLLYHSLPSADHQVVPAVGSVQYSPVDEHVGKLNGTGSSEQKSEQSVAAIISLDPSSCEPSALNCRKSSNSSIQHLASSLQGSVISPQCDDTSAKSFQLANHNEALMVSTVDEFIQQLQCEPDAKVKVVTIFGKTGEGKSYTLNHTFFDGCEVFSTEQQDFSSMATCTNGIWAAFDPVHEIVLFDTEGWQGTSATEQLHMRHLFKVFAVSDVVIVQTKSEHLHSDIFHFLANASSVYQKHVLAELNGHPMNSNNIFPISSPAVVIFHETCHADILAKGAAGPAESILRSRFRELGLNCDFIETLQYVGIQNTHQSSDFRSLLLNVKKLLLNKQCRAPREPAMILKALKKLYDKFTGSPETLSVTMTDSLCLTCKAHCLSCSAQCKLSMNHDRDGLEHETDHACEYQKQFDNRDYLCKACCKRGLEVTVVPKAAAFEDSSWLSLASYAWSGYVLECSNCNVIYRSRQHWFGNVDPEHSGVLKARVRHIWPGTKPPLQVNVGRHILDSLTQVSNAVAAVSATPTKVASSWIADRLAPSYWVPDSRLKNCHNCKQMFGPELPIHHCRACGQGFCDKCTSKRKPVPERGWGCEAVRVCERCFSLSEELTDADVDDLQVSGDETVPRRVGEVLGSTVGTLASVVSYPLAMLRDAARPDYWTPDEDITVCCVCSETFDSIRRVHHCRACGQGVCDKCSPTRRSVPSRGWHYPVRVCVTCDANSCV